jgi:hypothetical protein
VNGGSAIGAELYAVTQPFHVAVKESIALIPYPCVWIRKRHKLRIDVQALALLKRPYQ